MYIISVFTSCITGMCDKVPIVCVVLEGGPGTLETVKQGIAKGIPAVIVEVCITYMYRSQQPVTTITNDIPLRTPLC